MVRRTMITLCCVLAVLLAVPATASAAEYTPYDGSISSTYTAIFEDVAAKLSLTDDYVFFRSGQYEYMLVAGDLTYDGSFSGSACDVWYISTNTGSYNTGYVFSKGSLADFSLSPGSALVYSNLGHFPDLVDRGEVYSFAILILLLVAIFLYLIRSIFSFTLRSRRW